MGNTYSYSFRASMCNWFSKVINIKTPVCRLFQVIWNKWAPKQRYCSWVKWILRNRNQNLVTQVTYSQVCWRTNRKSRIPIERENYSFHNTGNRMLQSPPVKITYPIPFTSDNSVQDLHYSFACTIGEKYKFWVTVVDAWTNKAL